MGKLNLLVHANGYQDANATNTPSLSNFKWNRELSGIEISQSDSKNLILNPYESLVLFSGSVALSADATTFYNLQLAPGYSERYRLSYASGTKPAFRALRANGADATTEITVTKNGKVVTFASTNGTPLNTAAVVVGDSVRVVSAFNDSNLGVFTIISKTSTSFSFENELGSAEVVILGALFADIFCIYSAAGVQIGNKVDIVAGFSPASQNSYEILDVSHNYIEFFSSSVLPVETNVSNNPSALLVYTNSKQFFYLEVNGKVGVKFNGSSEEQIVNTFTLGGIRKPGLLLVKSDLKSIEIVNKTSAQVEIYYISAE